MSDFGRYRVQSAPVAPFPTSIDNADKYSLHKQKVKRFQQDTNHRRILVYWMMGVVSIWLIMALLITMFNKPWCLYISENVLITLLATTTVNVLGLSKIILHGLFKPHGNRNNKKRR